MSAYPTLLIGLGAPGADAVEHAYDAVRRAKPDLTPLLGALVLKGEGLVRKGGEGAGDTLVVPIEGLDTDGERPWRQNAAAVEAAGRELVASIREAIQDALTLNPNLPLDVGRGVRLFVASGLADPVGSAALVPVLEAAQKTRRFFQNTPRQTHLALFTPERASLGGAAHARAAAVVGELEFALDHGEDAFTAGPMADDAWVFARQNANGMFAERTEDLYPVFARLVEVTLSGEALSDQSFRGVFQSALLGQRRRYNAVGSASLRFPREEIVNAAVTTVAHRALRDGDPSAEAEVSSTEAYAQSRAFIRRLGLERLVDLLRVDVDENEIYHPFAPRVSAPDASGFGTIEELRRLASDYENEALAGMRRAIGARREAVWAEHRAEVLDEVGAVLDRSESGGAALALAWLAAFEGVPSEFISGETDDRPLTLDALDRSVRGYFDTHFEPLLLGDIVDEERSDYLGGRSIGRRELLDRVVLDLETKRRNLERARGTLELLRDDLARVRADQPDPAPEGARGAGEEAITDTDADREERRAGSRAAHESQFENLTRRVAEAEADIVSFEQDVEDLVQIEQRTRAEVAQLDRALTDATQRRFLFDQLVVAFRDERADREAKFRKAVQQERSARREEEEARQQRTRDTAIALAVAAGLAAIVYGVAGWFGGWAASGTIELTAITFGVGALLAGVVWLVRSAAYRREARTVQQAVEAKGRALGSVVQAYRSHFAEQFEHALFASLADWRTGVRRFVEELRETLEAFREDYAAFVDAAPAVVLPEGDPTTEYVLPEGGVEALADQRAGQIGHRLAEFRAERPPSALFKSYRAGSRDALPAYADEMKRYVLPAFSNVRDMTLDQFLADAFPTADERARAVERAYRKAAPFVSSSEYGVAAEGAYASGPQVESIVFANVWTPTGSSPVVVALEHLGVSAHVGKGDSETEARLLRLDLGYAAFQLAPFVEAYHDLEILPDSEQEAFFTSEDFRQNTFSLIPSRIELGDASSPPRRAACLAIAFGIADVDGDTVRWAGSSYGSYAEWVRHLTSYRGRGDIAALEAAVAQHEDGRSAQELKEELEGCRRLEAWDGVEDEILKQEIYRHAAI